MMQMRTHTCNELRLEHVGQSVKLVGWMENVRAELRAKIKACEDEMEACGAREVELDNEINSPEVYNDPDLLRQKSDELSDLRFHQEELFAAWEAAMEEQEAYEQTQQPEE